MKLPVLSGANLVKCLTKEGYVVYHQTGSHLILRLGKSPFTRITVPNHKVIAPGTLLAIIRQAGISREQLYELLE